jgi:hypothetical protein
MTVIPNQEKDISLSILINRKFDLSWNHRELPDGGRIRNGKEKKDNPLRLSFHVA